MLAPGSGSCNAVARAWGSGSILAGKGERKKEEHGEPDFSAVSFQFFVSADGF